MDKEEEEEDDNEDVEEEEGNADCKDAIPIRSAFSSSVFLASSLATVSISSLFCVTALSAFGTSMEIAALSSSAILPSSFAMRCMCASRSTIAPRKSSNVCDVGFDSS